MSLSVWGGVTFTSTGRKIRELLNYFPGDHSDFYITSSYRSHTPGSHHGGRFSYGGSPTAAVDIGFNYGSAGSTARGREFADWLMQFSGDLVELIHSPRHYVKNGRRVGAYAASAHYNHIHVAMSAEQVDRVIRRIRNGGGSQGGGSSNSAFGPAGSVRYINSQQKEVNLAGYTPKLKVDGVWGPKTEAAVKWYQRKIGVTADGIWGKGTDAAHRRYKDGDSSGGGGSSSGAPAGSVRKVIDIQKGHNYYRYLLGQSYRLVEDGVWGKKTEANLKWLQKKLGVTADGIWGPATEAAYDRKVAALKGSSSGGSSPGGADLKVDGALGTNTIKALQRALGVTADGVIGPVTVRALQRKVGATPDGDWGPATTRKLQEYLNRV